MRYRIMFEFDSEEFSDAESYAEDVRSFLSGHAVASGAEEPELFLIPLEEEPC